MTRAEMLVRFAEAALEGLCKNPGVETQRSLEQMTRLARHAWDLALATVGEMPAEVMDVLDGPLSALEESRVRALLAERHPYCVPPFRIMHPDRPSEIQGGEQCERCKRLTDAGAARLKELTEIAANLGAAEKARRGEERYRGALARQRKRDKDRGDDGEAAGVPK